MIRLQPFDHRESPYERPNRKWVCGYARDGRPCRIGPDRNGHCQAVAECVPRLGDKRWHCTRPAAAGGACAGGPLPDGSCCRPITPCAPVRSTRARRGLTVATALTVVVALFAILLTGAAGRWFINPGPLTLAHADLGACDGCHRDLGTGPIAWLHAAVSSTPDGRAQACLGCHELSQQPLAPHGIERQALALVSARMLDPVRTVPGKGATLVPHSDVPKEVGCGTCHQEHRGPHANLLRMSDAKCQACHTLQFASLSQGHPAFVDFPYRRRTRIVFDHASHYDRHFEKSEAADRPTTCMSCHVLGPIGREMPVAGFETSCGACHAAQVRGRGTVGEKGIPLVDLPGLDLRALEAHGAWVGEWPAQAENVLTPSMKLLLSGDPEVAAPLTEAAGLPLLDLSDATDAQTAAVARVAWGIKSLLQELLDKGQPALVARVERALGRGLDPDTASALTAGLPRDVLVSARDAWFPNLAKELADHRAGRVPTKETPPAPLPDAAAASAPAPSGEQTDILGAGILGAAPEVAAETPTQPADQSEIMPGGSILGAAPSETAAAMPAQPADQSEIMPGGSILGAAPSETAAEAPTQPADQSEIMPGGSILGAAPSETAAAGPAQPAEQSEIMPGGNILGGPASPLQSDILGGGTLASAPVATAQEPPPPEESRVEPVEPADWSGLGGWYRADFALRYRPAGHADRFARAWLDVLGRDAAAADGGPAKPGFDALAVASSPGVCMKCHSVDETPGGAAKVNWTGRRPNVELHPVTKFKHAPHLKVGDEDSCKTCHKIVGGAGYLDGYKERDPLKFASSFSPIGLKTCAECHTPGRADDSCMTCHSYHVGEIPRVRALSATAARP